MPVTSSSVTTIHSLICKRDLPMGLTCLDSMVACSAGEIQFVFHEDGSLLQEDLALLSEHYPTSRIVTRKESDELVCGQLGKYPRCMEFKAKNIFGMKLLDIPMLSDGLIRYTDCDILYFRRFASLFGNAPEANPLFIRQGDLFDFGKSWRKWSSYRKHGITLPPSLNAGLYQFPKALWDLDYIEWFLSLADLHEPVQLVEQNCWAAMTRDKGRYFDTSQIYCPQNSSLPITLKPGAVAVHFIYPFKSQFGDFHGKVQGLRDALEPCDIQTVPAGECDLAYILKTDSVPTLKRETRRWLRRKARWVRGLATGAHEEKPKVSGKQQAPTRPAL